MICKITGRKTEYNLTVNDLKCGVIYEIEYKENLVIINEPKTCLICLDVEDSYTWDKNPPSFKFRKFTGKIELSNE